MIYKLALKYLKENKRKSWMMFITITIVAILISTLTAYTGLVKHNKLLDNIEKYGSYHYAVEEVTEEQTNMINNDPFVLETSNTYQYARFEYGNIGYVEDISLLPIRFIEGSMPTKDNEIAIEKSVLIQLGYEMKLNQTVTLDITDLVGNVRTQEYVVSGIMEDYSQYMLTSSLQIITSKINMPVMNNRYVTVKSIDFTLASADNCVRNIFVIPIIKGEVFLYYMNVKLMIFTVAFIGSLIILMLFITMNRTLEKRMILLRSAGATKSQVRNIVWVYAIYLTIPAIPIAVIISITSNYLLSIFLNLSFSYDLNTLIESILVTFLMVMIGSTYTATNASGVSLIGQLNVKKSIVRVRKNRKLTPVFLAKRHLSMQRGPIFSSVFILALMSTNIVHNIISWKNLDIDSQNHIQENHPDLIYQFTEFDNGQKVLNDLKYFVGIDRLYMDECISSIRLKLKDVYRNNDYVNSFAYVIYNMSDETMDLLELQKEGFLKGEEVVMILPKMYDNNGYLTSYPKEGAKIIQDKNIQVGDTIIWQGKTFRIQKIISDQSELDKFDETKYHHYPPYSIIVAPGALKDTPYMTEVRLYVSNKGDVNAIKSRMSLLINRYKNQPKILDNYEENRLSIVIPQKNIAMITVCAGILILVLCQRNIMNVETRKKELSIYLAVGMDRKIVSRLILYEGVWMTLFVLVVSLIFELFALVEYNATRNILHIKEYMALLLSGYLGIVVIIMGIYYFTSKRILKEDLKKYVRYKE